MTDYDRSPVAIGLEQTFHPSQHRCIGTRIIFQMNHNEVQAAGAKEFIVIIVVAPKMTSIVITTLEARASKVLVIEVRCTVRVSNRGLIMIARGNAVRHSIGHACGGWVFDRSKSRIGILPFNLELITVLGTVTQLRYKDDVTSGDIIDNPICLRVEDRRAAAIQTGGVVLRVGQSNNRKVRTWRRRA